MDAPTTYRIQRSRLRCLIASAIVFPNGKCSIKEFDRKPKELTAQFKTMPGAF
jgi:hypothetical protein